nr:uncharacterized protein LOC132598221 [Globicephala melas]
MERTRHLQSEELGPNLGSALPEMLEVLTDVSRLVPSHQVFREREEPKELGDFPPLEILSTRQGICRKNPGKDFTLPSRSLPPSLPGSQDLRFRFQIRQYQLLRENLGSTQISLVESWAEVLRIYLCDQHPVEKTSSISIILDVPSCSFLVNIHPLQRHYGHICHDSFQLGTLLRGVPCILSQIFGFWAGAPMQATDYLFGSACAERCCF